MLARVRYPKVPDEITLGLDGINYHISHYQKYVGFRAGTTWSPEKGSNTGVLVVLTEELRQYAIADEKKRSQIEISITNKAKTLLEKLKKE